VSSLPGQPDAPSGLARASALLASGTFVSRILGFISALVLANTLGTQTSGANTFALANQLPNNIYAIIAGGLLSAVFVPQIVRAGLHSDGGQRFINRLVTLGVIVFLAIAAIATLAAPLLVSLYAELGDGFSAKELALATAFAYWCLPQILFYALYSLLGEVLNARGIFGPFTWAPVLNNLVAIAGMVAFALLFGVTPSHDDVGSWAPEMIAIIAGSATLGVASQAFVLFFFWRRTGLTYRPDFRWRGVGLGRAGRAAAWVFGMILVSQIAGIVQTNVATLAGADDPSIAVLRFAWLIFMLPHSIVAVSIGTTYFTRMSGHARDGALDAVRNDVSSALRAILFVMVFAAAGLMVLAYPFSALFTGAFAEIQGMGNVVIAFLVGLVPFSVLFVLQRTFYAVEDTRTPFFIQLVQATLFVLGALLVAQLPGWAIALGIAAVTTIAGTVQAIIAAVILRRRIGGIDGRVLIAHFAQFFLAAIVSAAVGFGLLVLLGGLENGGFAVSGTIAAAAAMVAIGTAMAFVYLAVLALIGNRDLNSFVAASTARLRRGR